MQTLSDNYKSTGYASSRARGTFTLEPGKRLAVIVVDCVRAYLDPQAPLYVPGRFDDALAAIKRVIQAAHDANIPVVYTQVRYQARGIDGGAWYARISKSSACFEQGSPYGKLADGIAPRSDEVIVYKQYASSFFGTSLASTLVSMGVDTTLTIGFSTSGCVRATALDALQSGFISLVVGPACGDRHASVQEANLFDLQAKYADVLDEEETFALLKSRALIA